MEIKISAIFLMVILITGFSSFPLSMSNSSTEFADQNNSLNLISMAFADSNSDKGNDKEKGKPDDVGKAKNNEDNDDDDNDNLQVSAEKFEDAMEDAQEAIDDANEEIEKANEKIAEAYDEGKETLLAEQQLEEAIAKRDMAQESFDSGNFEEAEELAEEAKDLANEARGKLIGKTQEDLEDNDDIQEFNSDVATHLSSKTTICHKPGTPAEKTKQIPEAALTGHLVHGDVSGDCADTGNENLLSKKEMKRTEKALKFLERTEMLLQKLEQRIAQLEQRLQTLLDKVESGEYYGTLSQLDTVTKSYSISFDGTATSVNDESVTSGLSGEIFIENLMTRSDNSKFRVTGGEITVGDNTYDAAFGKVRVSSLGVSDEKDSMVVIIQTFDSEENDNTIKLTLLFDSAIEADLGTEPINFEIKPNSKISKQWYLSGSGTLSLE